LAIDEAERFFWPSRKLLKASARGWREPERVRIEAGSGWDSDWGRVLGVWLRLDKAGIGLACVGSRTDAAYAGSNKKASKAGLGPS